ncbi:MAG: DNA replication/repair protein RecF [Chloroflexi bacterium]|nr:DNA replication/repair protein RecF [Chloroflexota bacterium]
MHLTHLSLTNFRNYVRLELSLPDRLTVLQGANAQGKTNLLEAIHLLATARTPRAAAERELINWLALESPLPYARLVGETGEGRDAEKLELVLELASNGGSNGPVVRKQVRVNGAARRAIDLVGRLRVVLFLPEDVDLVAGAPGERRRYLDIALCQIAPTYCRALGEYNRVVTQRNALLRQLRDFGGDQGQLAFWDGQMAEHGSVLIHRRGTAIRDLDRLAADRHAGLTSGSERLHVGYLPSPDPDVLIGARSGAQIAAQRQRLAEARPAYAAVSQDEVRERFLAALCGSHAREIAAGASLLGPHRDDMAFTVDGRDLRPFGSRGQQRTAALALKLAEVQLMREETGESPLLLLDDVMSELDEIRRHALLDALAGVDQAIVTTTDWGDFSPELLGQARTLRVERGTLLLVEPVL